jgi:hypothetical protein
MELKKKDVTKKGRSKRRAITTRKKKQIINDTNHGGEVTKNLNTNVFNIFVEFLKQSYCLIWTESNSDQSIRQCLA